MLFFYKHLIDQYNYHIAKDIGFSDEEIELLGNRYKKSFLDEIENIESEEENLIQESIPDENNTKCNKTSIFIDIIIVLLFVVSFICGIYFRR